MKAKRSSKKQTGRRKYDPEYAFTLYAKHEGNLLKMIREEKDDEKCPHARRTLQNYERDYNWPERLAKICAETAQKINEAIVETQVGLSMKIISDFQSKLVAQLSRLPGPGDGPASGFAEESQSSLLRSIASSLKDLNVLLGGTSERVETLSPGIGYEDIEIEEAVNHPDGWRAGLDLLRRNRYGSRIPEMLS